MKPTNSNFSLNYYERSGSILTKAHELYLTGIKDPDTQVKHYHGLIDAWTFQGVRTISGMDPGPHQECFSFMYFLTDNTMTKIERAFLIAACQPTSANYSDLYTGNKGDIQFAEVSLPFNGFFINSDYVYQKAQDMLLAMRNPANLSGSRVIVDSNNFKYNAIAHAGIGSADGKPSFDTPKWWSEEAGRIGNNSSNIALGGDVANLINTENRKVSSTYANAVYTNGNANADSDINVYKNVVASMANSEHVISIAGNEKIKYDNNDNGVLQSPPNTYKAGT